MDLSGKNARARIALRSEVHPFIAMDVLSQAGALERDGHVIVHMEVGQPATKAPLLVRQAAARALETHRLGYTDALGLPELRCRIARHYGETYGIDVAPARIAVTTGSSGAFLLAFLATLDHGQRIALPMPGYPAYGNILSALGVETVALETDAASRWMPDAAMLERAYARTPFQALLLASPSNPTGTMVSRATLGDIARWCAQAGVWFISDEIYHGLTYDQPAASALEGSGAPLVINSFSKYYAMTGWRVGWMVLPETLVRPVECLAQSLFISVPALSQLAAIAAFDATQELEANKAVYARNRALLRQRLPAIGLGAPLPMDGAFYAYVDVGHLTNDSMDFAARMLHEAGVACTPGLDFDRARGNRFIRLSFAGSREEMAQGLDRIEGWLKDRQ